MKIALFSDIHANLPALEAVLADLDARRPDAMYCLGDLVGYNVWPNEVIGHIQAKGIPTIAGNYDYGVGRNSDDCGCAYKTEEDKAMGAVSIGLTNQWVTDAARAYLRDLPLQISVRWEGLNLLLVHGSPRRINEYLFEDRAEASLLRIMAEADADVLCFGHTHKPYHRALAYVDAAGRTAYRHAINLGSVGKPKDGDPRACYVLLTVGTESNRWDAGSVGVEFVRVPYDVERAARAVEESALPDAYARMLREAF